MNAICLQPVFKSIVWGGNRLKTDYGFQSDLSNIAEAWMLCAREDGDNLVQGGAFDGQPLSDVLKSHPAYLGEKAGGATELPLLIKFIDAKSDLSVQVHPDDEYARAVENASGKTEAWYILDCDEGASLIYGFNKTITKDEFRRSIEDNSFLEHVNKVPVHKGDVFFISAGTLHAIGGGILLAEVQQNCNTTYRVYDYNRLVNGKPRELHVDKAVDVTVTAPPEPGPEPFTTPFGKGLCRCRYFTMSELAVTDEQSFEVGNDSFVSLLVLDGAGTLTVGGETLTLQAGSSIFLPACVGSALCRGAFRALVSTL